MYKVNIAGMIIILLFSIIICMLLRHLLNRKNSTKKNVKPEAVVNSAVSLIDLKNF